MNVDRMGGHAINFVLRAFARIPGSLGSNWLGLLFPVVLALLTEVVGIFTFGLSTMTANWKKATGVGFAAIGIGYSLLFAWCMAVEAYQDHQEVTDRVLSLTAVVRNNETAKSTALEKVTSTFTGKLNALQQSCAEMKGSNATLERQTREEQTLIAGCQEDAIKRLAPVPFQMTPLIWEAKVTNKVEHEDTFLLITNQTREAPRIEVFCWKVLRSAAASPVGVGAWAGGAELRNQNTGVLVGFSNPVWSPQVPIRLMIAYTSDTNAECQFAVR